MQFPCAQFLQLLTYPEVESSSLSHPILDIIISAIITSYHVDCNSSVFSPYFLDCHGNMLHGILSTISVNLYSVVHHFLQITPNGNLHDSVNILLRYRTNMSITGVLCSPLLFLNVTGTHHMLYDIYPPSSIYLYSVIHPHGNRTHAIWHFIHPKCRSIFANTLAFANHSEFKLA